MFKVLLFSISLSLPFASFSQEKSVNDFQCIVQPVYRYLADGKPGREVMIKAPLSFFAQNAQVELNANGQKQLLKLSKSSDSSTYIILPNGVGLDKEANINLGFTTKTGKVNKTVNVPAMRYWTIYLYNHSHVDIGYTNTHPNVERLHITNILEGIKLANQTKDYPNGAKYKWNPEITWPIERLWIAKPDKKQEVIQAIKNNQLGVDASYLNLNTSVCADEELFHVFRFSRELQKVSGKKINTFQQMDVPGMTWGLIPVMAQEGVKYIMAWPNYDRAGLAHHYKIDQYPFWWVGPDGKSKVLFFQPGSYANSGSMGKGGSTGRPWFGQRDPEKVPAFIKTGSADVNFTDKLIQMEKDKYPYDFLTLSWSLWDNNPIDADIPDAVKKWNQTYAWPKIIITTGQQIMEDIEQKYGPKLPVIKGDYTEYWTDGLGTAANLTAINRNTKEQLIQAENLWTMLNAHRQTPRHQFNEAWRYIALGSEHTWCFENPAEPFFQDAIFKVKQSYFHEAADRAQDLYDDALAPITNKSDGALGPAGGPSAGGVAVFNTHSWTHGGLITLNQAEGIWGDEVIDEAGKTVPSQRLSTGELVFMADNVAPFSSKHYTVKKGNASTSGACKVSDNVLENDFIKLTIDKKTGQIYSLIDKKTGYNYADEKTNGGLNAFRWIPANVDAPVADSLIKISISEQGPLVSEITVQSQGKGVRSVLRKIRLVAGQPWAEISNTVDKLPLVAKDGIHFGFSFNIPDGITRYDIPWGVVQIEKDQWPQANRNWLTLQRWLDVSNDNKGITWCSLDAPLFEYGKMSANIALSWGAKGPWIEKLTPSSTIYSWVMNNHWHTNFPLTQDGPVNFRYRLLPHQKYDAAAANRFGMEQAQPLAHVMTKDKTPTLPFVELDNDKVAVTILKSTGENKAVILRLRSLSDKNENVNLNFKAKKPKAVYLCDIEENKGKEIKEAVSMLPYGMAVIRVEW